jgi:4-hydroxy-2-oxoheptanedioate aldolase
MGLLGRSADPQVQQAITDGIAATRAARKAAGVLTVELTVARRYIEVGATFVAVGLDTSLLVRGATELARQFKSD